MCLQHVHNMIVLLICSLSLEIFQKSMKAYMQAGGHFTLFITTFLKQNYQKSFDNL